MWASRKPIKIRPVMAIKALSATVDLVACWAGVKEIVATLPH
jgi:hypothetical protein